MRPTGLAFFLQHRDRWRGWFCDMHASFHCICCMLCIYSIYCYAYLHRWYVKCVYCIYFCLKFLSTLALHWRHEFICMSAWRSKRDSPEGPARQLAEGCGPSLPPAQPELGSCPGPSAGELPRHHPGLGLSREGTCPWPRCQARCPPLTRAGRKNRAVHVTCLQPESELRTAEHVCSRALGGSFRKGKKERTKTPLKITLFERKQMGEAKVLRWFLLGIMLCLYNLSLTTCFIYIFIYLIDKLTSSVWQILKYRQAVGEHNKKPIPVTWEGCDLTSSCFHQEWDSQ